MNLPHRPLKSLGLTLLTAGTLVCALAPAQAEACGGTFCDQGPTVMPVDQTGENILFWIDRSDEAQPYTEAHIQIQYEGDPEKFAWIVPVMEVPEVLVGSQALFDNILAATVPTFTINTTTIGDCFGADGFGCAFAADAALAGGDRENGTGFGLDAGDEGGDTGGPEILDRGFAGAFEYVTLTGNSVQEVVDWLETNGYAQDDEAPPILQEYLDEDFVFVAFKLRGGTDIDEIHPLAIRYPGVEPCIPIRLTRIAAVEDMAIRAFFLGENRVVPQNWPHVELNMLKLDWLNNPALSYNELVSNAIDEADGRAFVTEYAGPDAIIPASGIDNPSWDSAAFVDIEPIDVVDTLTAQGLMSCGLNDGPALCTFAHPQVEGLLERYLPAPEGMDAHEFWECVACYEGLVDPVAWGTQPGFAAEFEERISGPAEHALDMLTTADYLTRLFTLISPHEMLEDPLFHETESLGEVDNNFAVTQVFDCGEGPDYFEFDEGHRVAVDFEYPAFEDMPSAQRIERVPMVGPAQVESDNQSEIDDILDEYNKDHLIGPSPWNCSTVKLRPEAFLTMLALFGFAWWQRPRARRGRRRSQ